MSVDAVTEAGEIRRRSILLVLRVVAVFLPIAAFTAETTFERAAYAVAVPLFVALLVGGQREHLTQHDLEAGLLGLGSLLVTVLFAGELREGTSVAELVHTATSFGARNSLMLIAGSFLLHGPRRGVVFSLGLLATWTVVTVAAVDTIGEVADLLVLAPDILRAMISTVVTVAILWALTSQNVAWSSGAADARKEAEHDVLTGLANRRGVLLQMESVLNGPVGALCIAMVDIDHFKTVNDTHGHDVGDTALRAVARTLQEQVRDGDLVARWGGEEFVVIFSGVGLGPAAIAAERCRAAVAAARPRRADDPWFPPVTASFGLARLRPNDTPVDLMRRADEQLYRAKEAGRDRVCSPMDTGVAPD